MKKYVYITDDNDFGINSHNYVGNDIQQVDINDELFNRIKSVEIKIIQMEGCIQDLLQCLHQDVNPDKAIERFIKITGEL